MTKPLQRRDTRHSGEGGVDAAAGIPRTFTTHSLYAESVSQSLPHSYLGAHGPHSQTPLTLALALALALALVLTLTLTLTPTLILSTNPNPNPSPNPAAYHAAPVSMSTHRVRPGATYKMAGLGVGSGSGSGSGLGLGVGSGSGVGVGGVMVPPPRCARVAR